MLLWTWQLWRRCGDTYLLQMGPGWDGLLGEQWSDQADTSNLTVRQVIVEMVTRVSCAGHVCINSPAAECRVLHVSAPVSRGAVAHARPCLTACPIWLLFF